MAKAEGKIQGCVDWLAEKVRDVPGDFAEFGVFEGGVVDLMAKHATRTVWAFDTFEGIPKENYDPELDHCDPPGKWCPAGNVPKRLTETWSNVRPVQGRFEVTCPTFPPGVPRFALVHLDCDNYIAYKTALGFLIPRLSPGAIVAVDDYPGCPGCKKAIDEFFQDHAMTWTSEECTKWFVWKPYPAEVDDI